jgi:CRP/FNR family transcriptional regulator, anaerobic regulatory protein
MWRMEKTIVWGGDGPAITAAEPWTAAGGQKAQLLGASLADIASIVRFKKGAVIYRVGDRSDAMFNIIMGVVTAYRETPNGGEHIAAFAFPKDLLGLSEEGRYINATRAATAVTAYRFPVSALRGLLLRDPELEFHFICKLYHDLRQAQWHALLLSQRRADSRLAMFLQFIERSQVAKAEPPVEIFMPMSRSDVAEYVGLTLAALSRAFRSLTTRGIIKVRDLRHISIVDRDAFESLSLGSRPVATPQHASASW